MKIRLSLSAALIALSIPIGSVAHPCLNPLLQQYDYGLGGSSGRSGRGRGSCYQVAAFIAPDLLRCTRAGTNYLGQAIWTCCN